MNNSQKGDLCEILVLTRFLKLGLRVSIPYGPAQPYDLVVENGTGLKKVQVKSITYDTKPRKKGGEYRYKCANISNTHYKKGGGYRGSPPKAGDYDFLVSVDADTEEMWVIPGEETVGRSSARLKDKWFWEPGESLP